MSEQQRTDLYCHACDRSFIAQIDHRLDGNHEIACPSCGHLHYRVVTGGAVTGDRYDHDAVETHRVPRGAVWRSSAANISTLSASHFLRERWLNRSDLG